MATEEEESNALAAFTAPGSIPTPAELEAFDAAVRPLSAVGEYKPEEDDPNVLIFGPWLERGGSAFWVSTAGTGKSIASIQLAHAMSAGLPFCGLRPRGRLKFWIFQSEDSPRRVAQDRIDTLAELAEQYPDVDWKNAAASVWVATLPGKVGVDFLAALDRLLGLADGLGQKPDVIILNPFLAFVGGPITDGAYVTPFLRGGVIGRDETCGLQAIIERHGVGILIFHHTPKPPTEKELDGWMKSAFPEYQGAGSSDITNWGRSFVTMMKVKNHPNMVCVTAGKNGAELGWEVVGGARRHYMAYSEATGVGGKGRHAWRDLTPEELDEVTGGDRKDDEQKREEAVSALVAAIKDAKVAPIASERGLLEQVNMPGISRNIIKSAIGQILTTPDDFRLKVSPVLHATNRHERHIGLTESIAAAQREQDELRRYKEAQKRISRVQNGDSDDD